MIHYNLHCGRAHEFDGWFPSSAAFDKQAKVGLLECPVCGGTDVSRALMAPAVKRKGRSTEIVPVKPAPAPVAVSGDRMPDQVRAALQRLRAEVEKTCDYVGQDFADEARRIHNGESEKRGIYGETTAEQAEALVDDGITVARMPWVPRADG